MPGPVLTLPTVYGWVSSTSHNYAPPILTEEATRNIVSLLIRRDTVLMDQVRQHCTKRWGIAAKLGRRTLHVRLFDLAERPSTDQYSGVETMELLVITPRLKLHGATAEEREQILAHRPFFYADRALTPAEIVEIQEVIGTLYEPGRPVLSQ
jgi:hypothetical protein